jgi:hypothetical protein
MAEHLGHLCQIDHGVLGGDDSRTRLQAEHTSLERGNGNMRPMAWTCLRSDRNAERHACRIDFPHDQDMFSIANHVATPQLIGQAIPRKRCWTLGRNRRPARCRLGCSSSSPPPGSDVRVTPLATMAQSVDQLRATTQPLVVFVFCFRPESARFVRQTFHVEHPAASRSRSGW